MGDDFAARAPAGAQHADRRPLRGDQAAHQDAGRQRRRGEEEQREEHSELAEALHVLLQGAVRGLVGPGQHVARAEPGRVAAQLRRQRRVFAAAGVVDHRLVGTARPGKPARQPLGREEHAEVLRRRQDVLPAARRPEVLRRGGDADDPHRRRPGRPHHGHRVADREVEGFGHVLLDQHAVGSGGPQVAAAFDLDPVDRRLRPRRQADHPAEKLVAADVQRQVRLGALLHRAHPRRAARRARQRPDPPAGHGQVGEAVLREGPPVGGVEVAVGVIAGAEEGDPEEDRQRDREKGAALAAHVAARLRPQRPRAHDQLTTRAARRAPAPCCARRRRCGRRACAAPGRPCGRSRRCG